MSKSIVTPVGRASFPHLAKPNAYGKYAITILFPKSNPKVKEFVQWLKNAVREEALNVAGQKGFQAAMKEFVSFKDGDSVERFKTYRSEYAGHWVLSASRKGDFGKPCVVNRQKQPIDPTEIYAGCDILAYIDVYGYTFGTKKSVTIGIQHIMKAGDNEPFSSSGVPVESAFDDIDLPEDGVGLADQEPRSPVETGGNESLDPFAGV
jgi:hypothetical protein